MLCVLLAWQCQANFIQSNKKKMTIQKQFRYRIQSFIVLHSFFFNISSCGVLCIQVIDRLISDFQQYRV